MIDPIPIDRAAVRRNLRAKAKAEWIKRGKIERAKRDPSAFIEYVLTDNKGQNLVQDRIHLDLQTHLTRHQYAGWAMPREHGKTTQVIGRLVWELGKDPNIRAGIVCNTDRNAIARVREVKDLIEKNPRVQEVFPRLSKPDAPDVWGSTQLILDRDFVSKDPTLEAAGIDSSGTGSRKDLLVFDDICDIKDLTEPSTRERRKLQLNEVWINLLPDEGRAWYIYTNWHQDDASASEVEQGPSWESVRRAIDDDLNPVAPLRWPKSKLQKRLKLIKHRAFARGFQLKPLADDELMFPPVCWTKTLDWDTPLSSVPWQSWQIFIGIDPAISKRKGSSDCVIFPFAMSPSGRKVPIWDFMRVGRFSSVETADQIIEINQAIHPDMWVVENNAYQEALVEWVHERAGSVGAAAIRITGATTGKNKMDEVLGLPGLAAEYEHGTWHWMLGDEQHKAQGSIPMKMLAQMREYPISQKTDMVMANWIGNQAAKVDARGTGEDDFDEEAWNSQEELATL